MSRGIFIQRLFHLCTFHLKVPFHFIAKAPKEHTIHPSVKGHQTNQPVIGLPRRKQDFSYHTVGFLDPAEKHSCGFSLIFIPLHLSCWASRTVPLVNHRCAVALTLKPLGLLYMPHCITLCVRVPHSLCCFCYLICFPTVKTFGQHHTQSLQNH